MLPHLSPSFFDAVAQGDPEPLVAEICRDFRSHSLKSLYRARPYRGDLVPVPRLDLAETLVDTQPLPEERSFIAGTGRSRPETVPLSDTDLASEHERDSIMRPWAVADAEGRVLPHWLGAIRVYLPKGRIATPSVRPNAPLVFPQTDEAVPVPTL